MMNLLREGKREEHRRLLRLKRLVVGSSGIEKNIDLMLCRRFKGRGMSWSRAGAQNLLKLKLLRYDRRDLEGLLAAKSELKN